MAVHLPVRSLSVLRPDGRSICGVGSNNGHVESAVVAGVVSDREGGSFANTEPGVGAGDTRVRRLSNTTVARS